MTRDRRGDNWAARLVLLRLAQLAAGGRGPALAAGVVVHAGDRAHAAGLGALLHHGEGVALALTAVMPDGAPGGGEMWGDTGEIQGLG